MKDQEKNKEVNVNKNMTNEDVDMVVTRSTPRNQETWNQSIPNQSIPKLPVSNDEVPADYARREERMNDGVIGAKKYMTLREFDDVELISNVGLFALAS